MEVLQLRVWNLHMFIHIKTLPGYDVNEDFERVTKFTKAVQCKFKRWYLSWCDTLTHWPPRPVTPQFCFQLTPSNFSQAPIGNKCRADSRFVPSQWNTALLCNDVSHWLGANLESALMSHAVLFAYFFSDHWNHQAGALTYKASVMSRLDVFLVVTRSLNKSKIEWWNLEFYRPYYVALLSLIVGIIYIGFETMSKKHQYCKEIYIYNTPQ